MNVIVHSNKLPISIIDKVMDEMVSSLIKLPFAGTDAQLEEL